MSTFRIFMMLYVVAILALGAYQILKNGILTTKETPFEAVSSWGGKDICFKDVWVSNWLGKMSKQDIRISVDAKKAVIAFAVDSQRAETLLSVYTTATAKLSLYSRARAITIHVSNEEEKKMWEDYVAKAREAYFENQVAARIPKPQKVTPRAI